MSHENSVAPDLPGSDASAHADFMPVHNVSTALAGQAAVLTADRHFSAACHLLIAAINETENVGRRRELAMQLITLLLKTLW